MLFSPDIIRVLLITCSLGMATVALLYLRQRRLPPFGYACWGLVALLIPFIGPFLVILSHPGEKRLVNSTNKGRVFKGT
jgi:hypothetical protein